MIETNDGSITSSNCCDKLLRSLREETTKTGTPNPALNKTLCSKINVIKEALLDAL